MITVFTSTPDELAKSLKSYFLIDEHFVILTIPEEIDDYLDSWFNMYDGFVDSNEKITFRRPFLVLTEVPDMFSLIAASFNTKALHEINNISEDGISFLCPIGGMFHKGKR